MKFKLLEKRSDVTDYLYSFLKSEDSDRGQTALKKYLFTNRSHSSVNSSVDSSYVVHHVNGDHSDYKDGNVVLMNSEDHKRLHNSAKSTTIKLFKNLKIKSNPQFNFLNLSNGDIQILQNLYSQVLMNTLNKYKYI